MMRKLIYYDEATGDVLHTMEAAEGVAPDDPHIEAPADFDMADNPLDYKVVMEAGKPTLTHSPNWEAAAALVKAEIHRLLVESDWTQLPDATGASQAKFATWRQALQQLPNSSGYPFDVVWPKRPPTVGPRDGFTPPPPPKPTIGPAPDKDEGGGGPVIGPR